MLRARSVRAVIGALCLALPGAAGAQTFEYGVKGGLAVTSVPLAGEVLDQVAGQVSRDSSSKLGLVVGGYIRFPLVNRFGFQPEALYVMKGVKLNETSGGTLSARTHYIDVPLLVRFRLGQNPEKPAYVIAGPNFGMKLGSSAKLDAPAQTIDLNIGPAIKTQDFGFAFGGGVERGKYLVEARFTVGLTDIGSANFPHPDSLRNRTFSVLGGWKLR